MITEAEFWNGRDKKFASELTPALRANAEDTLRRVNQLLQKFYAANPGAVDRKCNSGWRPPAVNRSTPRASPVSLHMICKAVDINDDDDLVDTWLMTPDGQKALVESGLWMEHPSATPRWAHVQTVPQRSFLKTGLRYFYP